MFTTQTPINQLLDEFLSDFDKAEGTKKLYRKTIGYFITWLVKNNAPIRNINRSHIISYKASLLKAGKSVATIDSYVTSIRKFFSWLLELGYVEKNITIGTDWMRDRNATFIKSALTIDQVYQLMAVVNSNTAIGKRNFALINLMSFTGLRCIEVTRLNTEDIIFAADKWHLQIQRKGSNEKSGAITVPDDIIKPIKEYWKYRSDDLTKGTPVFVNHAPGSMNTRLTPVCISRIIKTSLIRIDLNSNRYTAHSLRHTAATLAYYAGSENWEVGKMLGHRNPRQTEHYIHCLGIDSGAEGSAIHKINEYARKYTQTHK